MLNAPIDRRLYPEYAKEKEDMVNSLSLFESRLTEEVIRFIVSAYQNPEWDWTYSDGCTVVSEAYWASKYFPPCVAHDHQWEWGIAQVGTRREKDIVAWKADRLFREAMRAYGLSFPRRWLRWAGVRANWILNKRWDFPK